jgi:hypothetical protein
VSGTVCDDDARPTQEHADAVHTNIDDEQLLHNLDANKVCHIV